MANPATVYKAPDFDAAVLGRAKQGRQFKVLGKQQGAFFKILIRPGLEGYVADSEFRLVNPPRQVQKKRSEEPTSPLEKPEPKKKREFFDTSYGGVSLSLILFRESTMGLKPTENLMFIGYKSVGDGLLIEGTYGELNLQIHPGAPKYYEQGTGQSAGGYIVLADGMMTIPSPMGANSMTYFGFGPMFKYSKFDVAITVAGKKEVYSLNDMTVGAVFNYGLAQRIGGGALRAEIKYFWEKIQYYGFALTGQFEF